MGGAGERAALEAMRDEIQFDDAVNIQFTSGTTGSPKGVTLTHHNILNNGYFTGRAMRLTAQDRICIPVPLYHCFGMVMGNLAAVTLGAAMVYPGEGFDPLATLQTVESRKMHGAVRRADDVHRRTRPSGILQLRSVLAAHRHHGRRALPDRGDAERHRTHEHARRHDRLWHDRDQPGQLPELHRRSAGAPRLHVGRIHPHVEVKVIDQQGPHRCRAANAANCAPAAIASCSGYWDEAEKTREVIDAAGWMHTGDIAIIDAEGYGNIVGRIKDMVIRGGENLYPREIEEYLYQHPKIQDVQMFGVADDRYGEELCAWIRVRAGETLTPTRCAPSARGRSPTTRSRAMSNSSTISR